MTANWNRRVFLPFVLLLGFPGNFMLFRLAQSSNYRVQRWAILLKAIAIMDSLFLVGVLTIWLEAMDLFDINRLCNCGWTMVLLFSTSGASRWMFLLMNLDRTLFVMKRELSDKLFSVRNCRIFTFVIIVSFVISMLHWPFIIEYNETAWHFSGVPCAFLEKAIWWGTVGWPIYYNIIFILLPLVGILVCAIVLLRFVVQSKKRSGAKIKNRDRQHLKSAIGLSWFYIITSSPYGLCQLFGFIVNANKSCIVQTTWVLVNVIFTQIAFLVYSMKFWLIAVQINNVRSNFKNILLTRDEEQATTVFTQASENHHNTTNV